MSEDSALEIDNPLRKRRSGDVRRAESIVFGDVIRIRASKDVIVLDWERGISPLPYGSDRELYFDVVGPVLAVFPTPHGAVYVIEQLNDRRGSNKITLWMESRQMVFDV